VSGVRGRLTITLVALVVLTAVVLGVGSYLFVDYTLRQRLLDDARAAAGFDLSVLAPSEIASAASRDEVDTSGLLDTIRLQGVDVIVDVGDGDPATAAFVGRLSPALADAVSAGQLGFQWTQLGSQPVLVVGGRMPPSGPTFYFVHDATTLEGTLTQLRLALSGGALVLALLALLAARLVARGVLAPVEAASRAAERIERGDLTARVPVTSHDEFGAWAERFNRMAATLDETFARLRASQAQNRRFVADVSHELRTPVAALVAEASILRDHLDHLPEGSRRAGELLVADVGRLRILVDELMELSRFDAAAEQVRSEPIDLGRLVRAIVANRLPDARLELPDEPIILATEPQRVERILGNLLDNAREHAPGAPVEVSLRARPDTAVLRVADRGPGVADDRLARIFDRFFKADASRHGGSSGLGLAIAFEHATLLGGTLTADNRPGGGLEFTLALPVTGSLPGRDPAATDEHESAIQQPPVQEPIP
jgi:two-component system, OmpR family, sensor histidine kinase MtrB